MHGQPLMTTYDFFVKQTAVRNFKFIAMVYKLDLVFNGDGKNEQIAMQ